MATITVLKANVPHGPFTRAEVSEKLTRGEITLDSLAFVEGLAQWTPLRDVLARVDAAAPPPVPSAAFPPVFGAPMAVAPGAGYSYAMTMQPPPHLVYAGFWLRFVAIFIDSIILSPLSFIYLGIDFAAMAASDPSTKIALEIALVLAWLAMFIGQWLYFTLQESSRAQATLGKRLMGIQVTDRQGNRIGFGRATGRYFGKIISFFTICIGYMMAGWTQRKQALHDMLADTLVVRKPGA